MDKALLEGESTEQVNVWQFLQNLKVLEGWGVGKGVADN